MTVLSIAVGSLNKSNYIFDINYRLGDFAFYEKPKIKEILVFASRLAIKKLSKYDMNIMKHDKYHAYCASNHLIGCCIIMDTGDYSLREIDKILKKIIKDTLEEVDIYKFKHKDYCIKLKSLEINIPNSPKDQLLYVKDDLEKTKQIMIQNIEDVINRGEELENLIEQTEDLSRTSKFFFKKSKKMNQNCCVIN